MKCARSVNVRQTWGALSLPLREAGPHRLATFPDRAGRAITAEVPGRRHPFPNATPRQLAHGGAATPRGPATSGQRGDSALSMNSPENDGPHTYAERAGPARTLAPSEARMMQVLLAVAASSPRPGRRGTDSPALVEITAPLLPPTPAPAPPAPAPAPAIPPDRWC